MGNARTPFKMGRTKATAYTGDRKRKRQSVQPRTAEKYAFTEGNDKKTVEDKITRLHYEAASCVNGMKDCMEKEADLNKKMDENAKNTEINVDRFKENQETLKHVKTLSDGLQVQLGVHMHIAEDPNFALKHNATVAREKEEKERKEAVAAARRKARNDRDATKRLVDRDEDRRQTIIDCILASEKDPNAFQMSVEADKNLPQDQIKRLNLKGTRTLTD